MGILKDIVLIGVGAYIGYKYRKSQEDAITAEEIKDDVMGQLPPQFRPTSRSRVPLYGPGEAYLGYRAPRQLFVGPRNRSLQAVLPR